MHNYCVAKFYGHFRQYWYLKAKSEEDAWNRAEKDGVLRDQYIYKQEVDIDSPGYVLDLDEKQKEEPSITEDQYKEWLTEAIKKGMNVKPKEYEKVFGLPFYDVY